MPSWTSHLALSLGCVTQPVRSLPLKSCTQPLSSVFLSSAGTARAVHVSREQTTNRDRIIVLSPDWRFVVQYLVVWGIKRDYPFGFGNSEACGVTLSILA